MTGNGTELLGIAKAEFRNDWPRLAKDLNNTDQNSRGIE